MSIYRCSGCGFIGEDAAAAGQKLPCAKCGAPSTLFAAAFYVQKLAERYLATRRELETLKQSMLNRDEEYPPENALPGAMQSLNALDLANTSLLATEAQHRPLREWFAARHIGVTFEPGAVDTTGFFDEAAREIGEHYPALVGLLDQVLYAYRREFSWINIDLSGHEPATRAGILGFCRQLYSNTLFSRYSFKKQSQILGLGIQPAPVVRQFFAGAWLEWHALGTMLQLCVARQREFSCARNAVLSLPNTETRELDVAVLVAGRSLIVVECKTGEFRADIGKYAKLRQRLGIDQSQFIICNPELPDDQLNGLGRMYDLTFVNLATLRPHLESLV